MPSPTDAVSSYLPESFSLNALWTGAKETASPALNTASHYFQLPHGFSWVASAKEKVQNLFESVGNYAMSCLPEKWQQWIEDHPNAIPTLLHVAFTLGLLFSATPLSYYQLFELGYDYVVHIASALWLASKETLLEKELVSQETADLIDDILSKVHFGRAFLGAASATEPDKSIFSLFFNIFEVLNHSYWSWFFDPYSDNPDKIPAATADSTEKKATEMPSTTQHQCAFFSSSAKALPDAAVDTPTIFAIVATVEQLAKLGSFMLTNHPAMLTTIAAIGAAAAYYKANSADTVATPAPVATH